MNVPFDQFGRTITAQQRAVDDNQREADVQQRGMGDLQHSLGELQRQIAAGARSVLPPADEEDELAHRRASRVRHKQERVCVVCSATFQGTAKAKYCRRAHASQAFYQRQKQRRQSKMLVNGD